MHTFCSIVSPIKYALTLFAMVVVAHSKMDLVAATAADPGHICLEHNSGLLIKLNNKPMVWLITIVADTVLPDSVAYAVVWRFDDLRQATDYFSMQDQAGPLIPAQADLRRRQLVKIESRVIPEVEFTAHDKTFKWSPGNVRASWLQMVGSQDANVAIVDKIVNLRIESVEFESWGTYANKNNDALFQRSAVEVSE